MDGARPDSGESAAVSFVWIYDGVLAAADCRLSGGLCGVAAGCAGGGAGRAEVQADDSSGDADIHAGLSETLCAGTV